MSQFLNKKREDAEIKNLDDPSVFIEYSNAKDDVYNNIDDYNPKRKKRIVIVFHDVISDVMTNKNLILVFQKLSDYIPQIT